MQKISNCLNYDNARNDYNSKPLCFNESVSVKIPSFKIAVLIALKTSSPVLQYHIIDACIFEGEYCFVLATVIT